MQPLAFLSRLLLSASLFRLIHHDDLLLHLLLLGDSATRTLSGTGIRMSPLSPNRKSPAVAQTPVATDLHETFDIHGNGFAQIAFHHSVPLNNIAHADYLVFGQILYLRTEIHASLLADLGGSGSPDSIDIGQADLNPFVNREIDSRDSSHCSPPSMLIDPMRSIRGQQVIPGAAYAWDWNIEPALPLFCG